MINGVEKNSQVGEKWHKYSSIHNLHEAYSTYTLVNKKKTDSVIFCEDLVVAAAPVGATPHGATVAAVAAASSVHAEVPAAATRIAASLS